MRVWVLAVIVKCFHVHLIHYTILNTRTWEKLHFPNFGTFGPSCPYFEHFSQNKVFGYILSFVGPISLFRLFGEKQDLLLYIFWDNNILKRFLRAHYNIFEQNKLKRILIFSILGLWTRLWKISYFGSFRLKCSSTRYFINIESQ